MSAQPTRAVMKAAARVVATALVSVTLALVGLSIISASSPRAAAATASDFQAGFIISDEKFYDSGSMSIAQIQAFLNGKVSTCNGTSMPCLKDYSQATNAFAADAYCAGLPAATMSSAEIIARVGLSCGISPKVLIVMLQKEQGLITSTAPSSTQYRSAMGMGCPDTAACDTKYYGFANQVYSAARQMKIYIAKPASYAYQLGWNNILYSPNAACGTKSVNIRNNATRVLYIYTPYTPNAAALANLYGLGDSCSAYGNRNFWRYYSDWFGSLSAPNAMAASNLAGTATVTASSQNTATSQTAAKAVDGVATGYPTDSTKEWATIGGKAGSWIQLTWAAPVLIDRVVLYDRPNSDDQVTAATLVFSDSSTISAGTLTNSGAATTVTFAARTVKSVRLNITGVSATTHNVGLAEIQAWGDPAPVGNRPPVASAGADHTGVTGAAASLDGSGSSDPDGNALTYAWTKVSGPATTIDAATSAKASFLPSTAGTYEFELKVDDGTASSTDRVIVTVSANLAPQANAGADISVYSGQTVMLDGSASSDPNGTAVKYAWTQVGTTPQAVTLTGATAARPTFTPSAPGTYEFSLVVFDEQLYSAPDTVKVVVDTAPPVSTNLALKATASASSENTTTTQTAAKAIDGFATGYPTDYTREWATLGGKAGSWLKLTWAAPVLVDRVVLFDRPNTSDAITGATLAFSDGTTVNTGSLVNAGTATTIPFAARTVTSIQLNITQTSSATSNIGLAEIQVWGWDAVNRAPIANAGNDLAALTGAKSTLDGSGSTDHDGNSLTYAWTQQGTTPAAVTLTGAATAKPTFVPLTAGVYGFQLTVSDGKLSSTDTVSVTVTPNTAPIANAGSDVAGFTGKTVTLDGSASNDPDNTPLTYAWTQEGTTPAAVTLTGAATAKPTFIPAKAGTYTFRLTVGDGSTTASDTVSVVVELTPNVAPTANAGPDQTVSQGATVTLDGSASSDADAGTTLTYQWALTTGAGVTLVNPGTAKPTFAATVVGTFVFTLTVSDGVATATPPRHPSAMPLPAAATRTIRVAPSAVPRPPAHGRRTATSAPCGPPLDSRLGPSDIRREHRFSPPDAPIRPSRTVRSDGPPATAPSPLPAI